MASGEPMLSPHLLRRLMTRTADSAAERDRARAALEGLTGRERDVARAVGAGASNAEIGCELFMSVATVKAHVSRVLAKLGLGNRTELALLVHRADLD